MNRNYKDLTNSFENLAINPADFGHVDHVGVAYEMLNRHDFLNAMYKFSYNIHQMASSVGAPDKFNITITIGFLSMISERMDTTEHKNALDFIENNQDLVMDNPLKKYYSKERLQSDQGRQMFLMPDLV